MTVIEESATHILFKNDTGKVILKEKATGRQYRCRWNGRGYDCSGNNTPGALERSFIELVVDLSQGLRVSPKNE